MLHYGSLLVSQSRSHASMFHTGVKSRITATACKGDLVVVGFETGTLIFYNVVGRHVEQARHVAPPAREQALHCPVTSLCFSADGCYLAMGTESGTVLIFDLKNRTGRADALLRIVHSHDEHQAAVYSLCWAPDGTRVVSGDASGIVIDMACNPDKPFVDLDIEAIAMTFLGMKPTKVVYDLQEHVHSMSCSFIDPATHALVVSGTKGHVHLFHLPIAEKQEWGGAPVHVRQTMWREITPQLSTLSAALAKDVPDGSYPLGTVLLNSTVRGSWDSVGGVMRGERGVANALVLSCPVVPSDCPVPSQWTASERAHAVPICICGVDGEASQFHLLRPVNPPQNPSDAQDVLHNNNNNNHHHHHHHHHHHRDHHHRVFRSLLDVGSYHGRFKNILLAVTWDGSLAMVDLNAMTYQVIKLFQHSVHDLHMLSYGRIVVHHSNSANGYSSCLRGNTTSLNLLSIVGHPSEVHLARCSGGFPVFSSSLFWALCRAQRRWRTRMAWRCIKGVIGGDGAPQAGNRNASREALAFHALGGGVGYATLPRACSFGALMGAMGGLLSSRVASLPTPRALDAFAFGDGGDHNKSSYKRKLKRRSEVCSLAEYSQNESGAGHHMQKHEVPRVDRIARARWLSDRLCAIADAIFKRKVVALEQDLLQAIVATDAVLEKMRFGSGLSSDAVENHNCTTKNRGGVLDTEAEDVITQYLLHLEKGDCGLEVNDLVDSGVFSDTDAGKMYDRAPRSLDPLEDECTETNWETLGGLSEVPMTVAVVKHLGGLRAVAQVAHAESIDRTTLLVGVLEAVGPGSDHESRESASTLFPVMSVDACLTESENLLQVSRSVLEVAEEVKGDHVSSGLNGISDGGTHVLHELLTRSLLLIVQTQTLLGPHQEMYDRHMSNFDGIPESTGKDEDDVFRQVMGTEAESEELDVTDGKGQVEESSPFVWRNASTDDEPPVGPEEVATPPTSVPTSVFSATAGVPSLGFFMADGFRQVTDFSRRLLESSAEESGEVIQSGFETIVSRITGAVPEPKLEPELVEHIPRPEIMGGDIGEAAREPYPVPGSKAVASSTANPQLLPKRGDVSVVDAVLARRQARAPPLVPWTTNINDERSGQHSTFSALSSLRAALPELYTTAVGDLVSHIRTQGTYVVELPVESGLGLGLSRRQTDRALVVTHLNHVAMRVPDGDAIDGTDIFRTVMVPGPAERCGLVRVGDTLLEIDDVDVGELDGDAAVTLLKELPRRENNMVTFRFSRGKPPTVNDTKFNGENTDANMTGQTNQARIGGDGGSSGGTAMTEGIMAATAVVASTAARTASQLGNVTGIGDLVSRTLHQSDFDVSDSFLPVDSQDAWGAQKIRSASEGTDESEESGSGSGSGSGVDEALCHNRDRDHDDDGFGLWKDCSGDLFDGSGVSVTGWLERQDMDFPLSEEYYMGPGGDACEAIRRANIRKRHCYPSQARVSVLPTTVDADLSDEVKHSLLARETAYWARLARMGNRSAYLEGPAGDERSPLLSSRGVPKSLRNCMKHQSAGSGEDGEEDGDLYSKETGVGGTVSGSSNFRYVKGGRSDDGLQFGGDAGGTDELGSSTKRDMETEAEKSVASLSKQAIVVVQGIDSSRVRLVSPKLARKLPRSPSGNTVFMPLEDAMTSGCSDSDCSDSSNDYDSYDDGGVRVGEGGFRWAPDNSIPSGPSAVSVPTSGTEGIVFRPWRVVRAPERYSSGLCKKAMDVDEELASITDALRALVVDMKAVTDTLSVQNSKDAKNRGYKADGEALMQRLLTYSTKLHTVLCVRTGLCVQPLSGSLLQLALGGLSTCLVAAHTRSFPLPNWAASTHLVKRHSALVDVATLCVLERLVPGQYYPVLSPFPGLHGGDRLLFERCEDGQGTVVVSPPLDKVVGMSVHDIAQAFRWLVFMDGAGQDDAPLHALRSVFAGVAPPVQSAVLNSCVGKHPSGELLREHKDRVRALSMFLQQQMQAVQAVQAV